MTVEAFSSATGLDLGVLRAQVDRGYWPTMKVGKRRLINCEVLRLKAAERAEEFQL
jgi:hypothetical protein